MTGKHLSPFSSPTRYLLFTGLLFLNLPVFAQQGAGKKPGYPVLPDHPLNVILMIGDGMGLAQISSALYANYNQLALEQFPIVGFHKSYAYDQLVTDSAAGATAFDALHVACAIHAGAALFVTTDDRLLRIVQRRTDIRAQLPQEALATLEHWYEN